MILLKKLCSDRWFVGVGGMTVVCTWFSELESFLGLGWCGRCGSGGLLCMFADLLEQVLIVKVV